MRPTAFVLMLALLNPLNALTCTITFPANCDCTVNGKVDVSSNGHIADVDLKIGTVAYSMTFFQTETTAVCGYCDPPTDTKKAGVKPVTGKTWGTVMVCGDLEGVCCP